jgi:hypothetical protein
MVHVNILIMIVKYWAGTITPAIIQETTLPTWALVWFKRAQKAENEGKELVVLEVPKDELTGCLMSVEESLETFLRLDVG